MFFKKKAEEKPKRWENNIQDWTIVTKEIADLMVKECELALAGTIDSCDSVTGRSEKLVSIYIPISTALMLYIITQISTKESIKLITSGTLFITSVLCFIASFVSLILSYWNLRSYNLSGVGMNPEKITDNSLIENDFNNDLKLVNIALQICDNAKNRMDINTKIAKSKSKKNDIAIQLTILFPIYLFVGYLLHLFLK